MKLNSANWPRALVVAIAIAAMGARPVAAGSLVLINGDGKLQGCEPSTASYTVDRFQMELGDGGRGVGFRNITTNLASQVNSLNSEQCNTPQTPSTPSINICAESQTDIEGALGHSIATIDQVKRLQSGYLWGLGSNGQVRYLLHHVVSGSTHKFNYYEPYASADASQVSGAYHVNCGAATSDCEPFAGWPSSVETTPLDIPEVASNSAPIELRWDQPDTNPWSSSATNAYHYGYTLTLQASLPPSVLHSVTGHYYHQQGGNVKRCTNATFPKQAIVNDTGPIKSSLSFTSSIFDLWNPFESAAPPCVTLSAMEDFPPSMSQVQARLWYGTSSIHLGQLVQSSVTSSMTLDAASVQSGRSVFDIDAESGAKAPREIKVCAAFNGPFQNAAVAVAEYTYFASGATADKGIQSRLYVAMGREKRSTESIVVAALAAIAALLLLYRVVLGRTAASRSS